MSEDKRAGIQGPAASDLADGQCDHGRDDEANVDEDAGGLDARHDVARDDRGDGVDEDQAGVEAVDYPVAGRPGAIARNRDAGENEQRERVYSSDTRQHLYMIPRIPNGRTTRIRTGEEYNQLSKCPQSTRAYCYIPPENSAVA